MASDVDELVATLRMRSDPWSQQAADALVAERDARVKAEKELAELHHAIMGGEPHANVSHGQYLEMLRDIEAARSFAVARATAAEAKLAEVEKEKLSLRLEVDGLRAGSQRIAEALGCEDEPRAKWMTIAIGDMKASLATATEALRRIDSHIVNDNGDVTWSPLTIREVIRTALSQIEAGTVEHPDTVRHIIASVNITQIDGGRLMAEGVQHLKGLLISASDVEELFSRMAWTVPNMLSSLKEPDANG